MRNNTIPKTLQKAINDNLDIIEEYHMEEDFFGEPGQGNYSIWITLKDGYEWEGIRTIHEATVKNAIEALKSVQKILNEDTTECHNEDTQTEMKDSDMNKRTAKVTYQQAVELFKAGKISEEQFNKIYEMHHKKMKEENERNCVEVTVKPMF